MGDPIRYINIYINIIRGGAMNIDKAIRKQRRSYKIFMLTMSFIFLILPTALFATELRKNLFLVSYMVIIELLVTIIIEKSSSLSSVCTNATLSQKIT